MEIAYLKLRGQRQGDIRGPVTEAGHEGAILVIAARNGITVPHDPASGLASGRCMHKSFVITKPVDRSSPLLYNALAQNETIVQWELEFISPASALPSPFYTVRLTNALISDIEFSFSDGANANPTVENVSFTYQKIEWVWNDGNIEATDTWQPATA